MYKIVFTIPKMLNIKLHLTSFEMLNILYTFAINKTNNMTHDLEYSEFFVELWSGIDGRIVSEEYMARNDDFINSLTFDLYRLSLMTKNMDIAVVRRIVESTFSNLSRFRPN